jgi:aminopeptidase YwaD
LPLTSGTTFECPTQIYFMKTLLLALTLIPLLSISQTKKQRKALEAQQKADMVVVANLKNHVTTLSGNGDALNYISTQFKNIGLQPKGTNGYIQQFEVEDGRQIDKATSLKVNGAELQVNKHFFPLPYSASKSVNGMPAMALRERGVPWFLDVKDMLADTANKADFSIDKAIQKEATKVAAKGASALFVYNSGSNADGITFNKMDKSKVQPIPVVYIMPEGFKKYFSDDSQLLDIELNTSLKEGNSTLNNVVGYLDNGAPTSIVISSAFSGKADPDVHSNCGGAATLLELSKMMAATKAKKNNYVFLISTGKYADEAGTKHWLNHATVTTPINYSINLSTVSIDKPVKKLTVEGAQSSSIWAELLKSGQQNELTVETSTKDKNQELAGFYQKNIPVISLSTTEENSNVTSGNSDFTAGLQIAKFVNRLVEAADAKGKATFTRSPTANIVGNKAFTDLVKK